MKFRSGVFLLGMLLLIVFFMPQPDPAVSIDTVVEMRDQEVDYFLSEFSIKTLGIEGGLKHTLSGDRLVKYKYDGSAKIDAPTLQLSQPNKSEWRMRAQTGLLSPTLSRIDLQGGVVLEREASPRQAALYIQSRDMLLDIESKSFRTDSQVHMHSEHWKASAVGLRGNTETGEVILLGSVVMSYER